MDKWETMSKENPLIRLGIFTCSSGAVYHAKLSFSDLHKTQFDNNSFQEIVLPFLHFYNHLMEQILVRLKNEKKNLLTIGYGVE